MFDLADFIDWYAAKVRRSQGVPAAPNTLRCKASRLRWVARVTGARSVYDLAAIVGDPEVMTTLALSVHEQAPPATAAQVIQAIKDVGDFLVARGHLSAHCVTKEHRPKSVPRPAISVYSTEEVEGFIAAARGVGLRWWVFLATVADTGRRASEVLGLRWSDLHLDTPQAYFDLPMTKTKRQQYVPLSTRLRTQVFTPANIDWLKTHRETGRNWKYDPAERPFPWTYHAARARFEKFCEKAGLPQRGFHCFRHTKATEMLARGVPIQAVSALLRCDPRTIRDTWLSEVQAA